MSNIVVLLVAGMIGLCIILYGMTRTETNFNMLSCALTTDGKIENKKGFLKAYKINSLIIGFLLLISSLLMYLDVLSDKYMSLYLLPIILLKSILRIVIQVKYTKRPAKVKNI